MIHLYNKNKVKLAGLIDYKNLSIEKVLESGDKTLSFSYPKTSNYYFDIEEECYIRTKEDEFVVKEKNVQRDYTEFKCVLNLEDVEGKPFERYESVEQPIDKALALALAGTGWIIGKCSLKKKRTVRMSNCSSLEIIREIKKTYRCDLVFNTLTRTIDVYEHLGEDKGTYFIDSLNLKELSIQGSSYEYYTRIIPIGKDDLRITDINSGKEYVENYQYSNKIKTVYWKDDRYTIVENLKEDAQAKLAEISKPYRAYVADIINLAKLSEDYKDILDYKLGDTITLISKDNKFRDKQRIVKIVEHPDEHELDSIELANTILSFEEIQTQFQEAADTVNNITSDNGTIDGSTIDSIKTEQISDFETSVAKITDLTVINAKVSNLEAFNVTISGELTAVKGTIGTLTTNIATIDSLTVTHSAQINDLQANKASITQLQATNTTIQVLETNVGNIQTLLNKNLSSENIQAGGITGDCLNMKTIFVDDANILSINASKIHAGEINTNKVKITSDDGGIEIVGATQQFKDKNNKVRIQMGKDAQGNFNFIIRGEDGTTTLIDHTGVKEKAIADDLIKSNMISSNSVGEKQIDYSSFSEGFNKDTNTHTLNSTKIKLNNQNQTLDGAFNSLKTQSDVTKSLTERHSTTIGVMQGQINTAINNTQIIKDGKTVLLKDDYNRTVETVDSLKSIIGSHTTQINQATGKINNVETKVNTVERDLNSITARVSSTEINITNVTNLANDVNNKIDNLEIGGRNLLKNSKNSLSETLSSKEVGSLTIDKSLLSGKTVTISLYFDFEGLAIVDGKNDRLGYEIGLTFDDDSSFYIGCWMYVSSTNFKGRKYNTVNIPNKPIKSINYLGLYIQCNATKAYIANPKLEFGNKATDYTEAPEDFETVLTTTNNKVAAIETNLSSITSRVSNVETTTVGINGKVSNLSTRMNLAEQRITDASIVSIVSSQFYTKGQTDNLYASKSQLTQTDNKFQFQITQSGNPNYVLNSNFMKVFKHWEKYNDNYISYSLSGWNIPTGSGVYIVGQGDKAVYVKQTVKVPPKADKYHASAYLTCTNFLNIGGRPQESLWHFYVVLRYTDGTGITKKVPCWSDTHTQGIWKRQSLEFDRDPNKTVDSIDIYLYVRYVHGNFYMGMCKVETDQLTAWCTSQSELNSGIVEIDGQGIYVLHTDGSTSKFTANDLQFTNENGKKKMAIKRGGLAVYNYQSGLFLGLDSSTQFSDEYSKFGMQKFASKHCSFYDILYSPNTLNDDNLKSATSIFRICFENLDSPTNWRTVKGIHSYDRHRFHEGIDLMMKNIDSCATIFMSNTNTRRKITTDDKFDELQLGFSSGGLIMGQTRSDGSVETAIKIYEKFYMDIHRSCNFMGNEITNAVIRTNYSLSATSPGHSVGADTASVETMLLQEDFSEYDEKNNAVVVNINEAVKSVYEINKKLENENAQLKQENENLNKELETTKNALDTILMDVV